MHGCHLMHDFNFMVVMVCFCTELQYANVLNFVLHHTYKEVKPLTIRKCSYHFKPGNTVHLF